MEIKPANRVLALPESYVFDEQSKSKRRAEDAGLDIIDFGIGDHKRGRPEQITDAICELARDKTNHRYPDTEGPTEYRRAWANLYARDMGVLLDPDTEVHAAIGGKEGIAHIAHALLNPGDVVIIPEPAYPVYRDGTILALGEPYFLPLREADDFLPSWDEIPENVAARTRIVWLSFPHNPTGAEASSLQFLGGWVSWCRRNGVILLSDATYSHLNSRGKPTASVLQIPEAKEIAAEFHSVSKTFCATGDRAGVLVGNSSIIKAFHRVKASVDSGQADYILKAYAEWLLDCDEYVRGWNHDLDLARAAYKDVLNRLGIWFLDSQATFYVWARVPEGFGSDQEFCSQLLEAKGIVFTPGSGFGESGAGYFRASLAATNTVEINRAAGLIHDFLQHR
jgi:LL-diaminopimelate aminotransferase